MKKQSIAALLSLAALAFPASAKTYYVKTTGEDVDPKVQKNAGLSEGAAFRTVQFAIDKAAAGSTILVYPGEYDAIRSNNKKLVIKAVESGSVELRPWNEEGSVVWSADLGAWGTQQLYGTSIQYGNKKWSGTYCVSFDTKLPNYTDCDSALEAVIASYPSEYDKEEATANGGASYDSKRKLVAVKGAKAPLWKGGNATKLVGIAVRGGENGVAGGTLESCSILDISGGVAAWKSSLTDSWVAYCRNEGIYGSTGLQPGAGSLVSGCTLTRCWFYFNTFVCGIDSSTLNNCVVAWNQAATVDDELPWWDAEDAASDLILDSKLYNCTVLGNTLTSYVADLGDGGPPVTHQMTAIGWRASVFNSIVWNNTGTDGLQHNVVPGDFLDTVVTNYNAKGKAVVTTYSPFSQFMNSCTDVLVDGSKNKKVKSTGNIAGDPCFLFGGIDLAPWSPCVNAGADYQSKTGKTDLHGSARKVGAKVDMGAVELQASTPVPADYDGDGFTDAALYFADTGDWWVWGSQKTLGTSGHEEVAWFRLPAPKGSTPVAADFDGFGRAQPGFFAGAEKAPFFVHLENGLLGDGKYGDPVTNAFATYTNAKGKAVSTKGATPVAAKFGPGSRATFGVYASTVAAPVYAFEGSSALIGGNAKVLAKGSKPVVADFTGDGVDDLGAYTSSASSPAFTILQSGSYGYAVSAPFTIPATPFYPTARKSIPLGAKGSIPCCADFDNDGKADFAAYSSSSGTPEFTRLFSTSKYSETRTMPMGSKGDVPVVGEYEQGEPANMAVFTGTAWKYCDSGYADSSVAGWSAAGE